MNPVDASGGPGPATLEPSVSRTRQWHGVIEEYRDLLDLPSGLAAVTLREGGTPLVRSDWLSSRFGAEVWLKVEGDNPTGSFKDRGMTTAISLAAHEGAKACVCASTGNTSASMAAYAARAGLKPLVLAPEGKISAAKMAQAVVHGAQVISVDDVAEASGLAYQRDAIGAAAQRAVDAGVLYVAAAGNDQVQGDPGFPSAGYPIGAWETDAYRPTTCPAEVQTRFPGIPTTSYDCLDFDPGSSEDPLMGLQLEAGAIVAPRVAWGQPAGGVSTVLQYVAVQDGTAYGPATALDPTVPIVQAGALANTDPQSFAIVRRTDLGDAGTPPVRWVLQQTVGTASIADLEHFRTEGPDTVGATLWGHESDPAVMAVAAANVDTLTIETFSDLGPTRFLFDAVRTDGQPAAPLEPPTLTPGPRITGVDRLAISFELVQGLPGVFPGTSCAGPTVAAVAALGRQASGGDPSPADLHAALVATANPAGVASPYPADVDPVRVRGAGLVDAYALVAALRPVAPIGPAGSGTASLAASGADAASAITASFAAGVALVLGAVLLRRPGRRRRGGMDA